MPTTSRGYVTATVYNGAVLGTTYSLTDATSGTLISAAGINSIRTAYASECSRRGLSAPSGSTVSSGGSITSAHINNLKSSIENTATKITPIVTTSSSGSGGNIVSGQRSDAVFPNGTQFVESGGVQTWLGPGNPNPAADNPPDVSVPSYTSGFAGISNPTTTTIKASDINALIKKVNDAGAVCLCNCNYCTCNCNYCTCNCNYACTCNCNYSDRRLKRNIKFLKNIFGINIYTFNYIWSDVDEVGVMAQELLKTKYKNCVYVDKKGFYMVDYTKLPFKI